MTRSTPQGDVDRRRVSIDTSGGKSHVHSSRWGGATEGRFALSTRQGQTASVTTDQIETYPLHWLRLCEQETRFLIYGDTRPMACLLPSKEATSYPGSSE